MSVAWSVGVSLFFSFEVPRWEKLQKELRYRKKKTFWIPLIFSFSLKTYFWRFYLEFLEKNPKFSDEGEKNPNLAKFFREEIEKNKDAAKEDFLHWDFYSQFRYILYLKQKSKLNWLNFYKQKINLPDERMNECRKFFAAFTSNTNKSVFFKIVLFFLNWEIAIWTEDHKKVKVFKENEKKFLIFDYWDNGYFWELELLFSHLLANEPAHFENSKAKEVIANILRAVEKLTRILFKIGNSLFGTAKMTNYFYGDLQTSVKQVKQAVQGMFIEQRKDWEVVRFNIIFSARNKFICCDNKQIETN